MHKVALIINVQTTKSKWTLLNVFANESLLLSPYHPEVLQVCVAFVLCSPQAVTGSPVDCPDQDTAGTSCTISLEKLLERAIQHADLIYRVSVESKLLFVSNGEMNLKLSLSNILLGFCNISRFQSHVIPDENR